MVKVAVPDKWIIGGVIMVTIGILVAIFPPYELMLNERLRMRPGLPPFDWWYDPPDVTHYHFYFFNITNGDRYLTGQDEKLHFEEVGPIVFKDILKHSNAIFNDNGTMTYTATHTTILDPSFNKIDLNTTLLFPNMAALLTASMFWDSNYFFKTAINLAIEQRKTKLLVRKSIYEILYHNTDPFLSLANSLAPSYAPVDNVGLMPLVFNGSSDTMTVYIGTESGDRKYFLMDNFNGSTHIPHRGNTCPDVVTNATIGLVYPQRVRKDEVFKVFNPIACANLRFHYAEEVHRRGMKMYKYVMSKETFNRTQPPEADCGRGSPTLPNGIADISPCWFSFPIGGSFPHFLYGNVNEMNPIDGMKPNVAAHNSYFYMEPITGVPVDVYMTYQATLIMKPLNGFHKIFDKFSDVLIPLFYNKIVNHTVPLYVLMFIQFTLWLPTIGVVLSSLFIIIGLCCIWKFWTTNRNRAKLLEIENAEIESFIEKGKENSKSDIS